MGWWQEQKWQRWRKRHPLPLEAWQRAQVRLPIIDGLSDAQLERLGERSWRLVHALRIVLPEGVEWSDENRLVLMAQIALMTLAWPEQRARRALLDVREIILVPGAFRRHVEEMDDAGVMHEFEDERAGETSWHGPVALSLEELEANGDWHGTNVVIHEFAHKLDMTGDMTVNGMPGLHGDITSREWYDTFMQCWQALQESLERGEEPPIDDYAATHPAEFFAVICEYFFTAPDILDNVWPDLYTLLVRYFDQDPLRRLPRAC
ncbi:M90 family metallopeptidase [Kushneria aurantia]|uniref:Zinc-dependent peptidase n=1 Tax=Kushneria aurantia TaxID=504092 RepID=A0ABV6G859_9GAMM|nr:M90 family metallopeptidase [Kushneria aurantia]